MLAENVFITAHGEARARERLGLKRRAVPRAVAAAWRDGIPYRDERGLGVGRATVKRWRGALFVFIWRNGGPSLVTVIVSNGDRADSLARQAYDDAQARREEACARIKRRAHVRKWARARDPRRL